MSVWDPTTHLTVTEAELLEGQNFDEALATKLGSNQEYSEAQRLLQVNAWTKGSDKYTHFSEAVPEGIDLVGGSHNSLNHYRELAATNDRAVFSQGRHASTVESACEFRVECSAHTANLEMIIGFSGNPTALVDNCVFVRGSNANTYKAQTWAGSDLKSEEDNIAANYIAWDVLIVQFFVAGVKYFVNGSLVATHDTALPTTIKMFPGAAATTVSGGETLRVDRMSVTALANDESP